ncbi:MAG: hypothetical protein J3Q66DRAFT_393469 [Benniella sp.]|nr:MAG: hypothetical protein J3Q66DRAFT_393469 [Benniella sp.]
MPRRASSITITPAPKRTLRSSGYVTSTVPIPNRNSFMRPRPRRSPYDKPADPKQQLIAFPKRFSSRRPQPTPDVTLDEINDDQVEEDGALAIPGTPVDDIDIGLDIDEVTINEIEEDQVQEEYELAIPGIPADGIEIDNMTTDEIEEKEGEDPTQAKDDDDEEYGIKRIY